MHIWKLDHAVHHAGVEHSCDLIMLGDTNRTQIPTSFGTSELLSVFGGCLGYPTGCTVEAVVTARWSAHAGLGGW